MGRGPHRSILLKIDYLLAQVNFMEQLYVTREAIEAYERRTGFDGLGQFMIDKGLFVLAEEKPCKTA